MATFRNVINTFYKLSRKQQEVLLRDLYNYSKDIKLFLESKLGLQADIESLIKEMERETIGKVYKKGKPSIPSGRIVNGIIAKARKANVSLSVMLELEKLAYRGFIEFLNEYGGGPESFDDLSCKHLHMYLKLVKDHVKNIDRQNQLFEEVRRYLLKKNNMLTDYVDEVFEDVTGIPVGRLSY